MSRQTRTLLIVGLLLLASIVALASMARRYRALLVERSNRQGAVVSSTPAPVAGRLPLDPATARDLDRFLEVRRLVRRRLAQRGAVEKDGESVMRETVRRLGWGEEAYRRVERLVTAWREGSAELPAPVRGALESRAEPLAAEFPPPP